MRRVTFINHDAENLQITLQHLRSINSHINAQSSRRALKQTDSGEEEPLLPPSPLDYQIGGLRDDPFHMLPIPKKHGVSEAFDYCQCSVYALLLYFPVLLTVCFFAGLTIVDTQFYTPLSLRVGGLQPLQARALMFNILDDSMFCESLIAMMLVMQTLHMGESKRQSAAILYHSNKAISELQQRLSSPEEMQSDTVICTIISQAFVQVSTWGFV